VSTNSWRRSLPSTALRGDVSGNPPETPQVVSSSPMRRRHVRPVITAQLARMTTSRLLAFRDRLLALEDDGVTSDLEPRELKALDPDLLFFKSDGRWKALYDAVRGELSQREHVPPK
jgi:hypothetical protein